MIRLMQKIKRKIRRELRRIRSFYRNRAAVLMAGLRQFSIWLKSFRAPKLAEIYKNDFAIGTAVEPAGQWVPDRFEIGNWGKEALIARCFSSVTCENAMKPEYNFNSAAESLFRISESAEKVFRFAKRKGLKVRVHVLVWHKQTNEAIFCREFQPVYDTDGKLEEDCLADRETLLHRLNSYIDGFFRYIYENGYADIVYAYDVVNEAASNLPGQLYRDSYWYRMIGPDYIYYSFLYARQAIRRYSLIYAGQYNVNEEDGSINRIQGELLYCDNYEWYPEKAEKINRMLKETVMNPVHGNDHLLDGIGMQGHITLDTDISAYLGAMKQYGQAFGSVHVTELDICPGETRKTGYAEKYKELFEGCVDAAAQGTGLKSVTFWGLNDGRSWQKEKACSLLFDDSFRAKEELYTIAGTDTGQEEKKH